MPTLIPTSHVNLQFPPDFALTPPESQADSVTATGGSATLSYANLSPEALLVYCQTQLTQTDTQIQSLMATQTGSNHDQDTINTALGVLTKYAGGCMDSDGSKNRPSVQAMQDALQTAIDHLGGPNTPAGGKLEDVLKGFQATGIAADGSDAQGDGFQISADEMTGFIGDVKSAQTDLGSGAELNMINLQSMVSQRQTFVQLTTNMMQSIDQGAKDIVGNIGH